MNRRNFFKVVTGFVAGIFVSSVEGKKFNTEDFGGWNPKDGWSAGIDPESEWAKQKPLYVLKSGPPGPTEIPAIWSVWYPDDTKAIQEAINLAEESGKVVYFPKGTYNLKYGIIV